MRGATASTGSPMTTSRPSSMTTSAPCRRDGGRRPPRQRRKPAVALKGADQRRDDNGLFRPRRPPDGDPLRRRRCRGRLLYASRMELALERRPTCLTPGRASFGFPASRTTCECCGPRRRPMREHDVPSTYSSIASPANRIARRRASAASTGSSSPPGSARTTCETRAEVIAGLAWPDSPSTKPPTGTAGRGYQPDPDPRLGSSPTNEELVIARQTRSVLGAAHAELAS